MCGDCNGGRRGVGAGAERRARRAEAAEDGTLLLDRSESVRVFDGDSELTMIADAVVWIRRCAEFARGARGITESSSGGGRV